MSTRARGNGSGRICFVRPGLSCCIRATSPGPTRCGTCAPCSWSAECWLGGGGHPAHRGAVGDYTPEREYREVKKGGTIRICPRQRNESSRSIFQIPDPWAEPVRRQITEPALLRVERARIGLCGRGEDLDVWMLTDGRCPTRTGGTGAVGGAGVRSRRAMLATCGVQLENVAHAANASGLFTAGGLKNSRARNSTRANRGVASTPISILIGTDATPPFLGFTYQLSGAGQKCSRGRAVITGRNEIRVWLEARLGPLACFEVLGEVASEAVAAE